MEGHDNSTNFMGLEEAQWQAKKLACASRRHKRGADLRRMRDERRRYYDALPKSPLERAFGVIAIPFRVINAPIAAVQSRLAMAHPETDLFVQQHVERLHGIQAPSRFQAWLLSQMTWLIEAPETEPESTETARPFDPALQDAFLAQLDPLPASQMQPSADRAGSPANMTSSASSPGSSPHDLGSNTVRGVR